MKEVKIDIDSLSYRWTVIANENVRVSFSSDNKEVLPRSVKNCHFCSPPLEEYFFDGFMIQYEYDWLSEKASVRKF